MVNFLNVETSKHQRYLFIVIDIKELIQIPCQRSILLYPVPLMNLLTHKILVIKYLSQDSKILFKNVHLIQLLTYLILN